ncbi:MAG: chromosomal replication initiator protein DnaA [Acidobacteriota bacterium]|jgi:chromosomal replication initiator protein
MDLWESVLSRLESRLDPHTFNTWLRPTALAWQDDTSLHVAVPNDVFRDWLRENYSDLIRDAVSELTGGPLAVEFTTSASSTPRPGSSMATATAATTIPPQAASADRFEQSVPVSGPLNSKYKFESFVVGASNQLAHAAARAVAESPSRSYNPLFLYGGVGLGKTHLMHAIGHKILKDNPDLRLVYISSERFMNELINSIRYDRTFDFREKYRNIDVLLMDDIQFLAGKERTQEEFFHTFNALYDAQRQIVLTSDSPPKEIPTLEERLRSRFEWGLLADIQAPDLETKIAILRKKGEAENVEIPDDVMLFIASHSKSNIRELEGALIRLVAYSSLTGETIDIDLARNVLRDSLNARASVITIDTIQENVADYFGLRTGDLCSKSNARRITQPRQIAMFLCKRLTNHSLPEIGRAFGGKHHSTVIHSVRKIENECESDEDIHRMVNTLLEALQ